MRFCGSVLNWREVGEISVTCSQSDRTTTSRFGCTNDTDSNTRNSSHVCDSDRWAKLRVGRLEVGGVGNSWIGRHWYFPVPADTSHPVWHSCLRSSRTERWTVAKGYDCCNCFLSSSTLKPVRCITSCCHSGGDWWVSGVNTNFWRERWQMQVMSGQVAAIWSALRRSLFG